MSLAITQRGLLDALSSKARQSNESNQDCKSQINTRAGVAPLRLTRSGPSPGLGQNAKKTAHHRPLPKVRNASRFAAPSAVPTKYSGRRGLFRCGSHPTDSVLRAVLALDS
jgi:hypothetical protein